MAPNIAVEWFKLYLQRSSLLYQIVMRFKSRRVPSLLVRRHQTKIVIEAFPRSSNSFAVRLFREANPEVQYEEVSHHSHIVSNVKQAAKWGIPALVIIRHPVHAIASNMIAYRATSDEMIDLLARKYLDFYEWIESNRDAVVLVEFRQIVEGSFRQATQELNRRFGTSFRTDFEEEDLAQRARKAIEEGSPHQDDPLRIPIPAEERREIYKELTPRIEQAACTQAAVDLYERLLPSVVDSGN